MVQHNLYHYKWHECISAYVIDSYAKKTLEVIEDMAKSVEAAVMMVLTEDQQEILTRVGFMFEGNIHIWSRLTSPTHIKFSTLEWDRSGVLRPAYREIERECEKLARLLSSRYDRIEKEYQPNIAKRGVKLRYDSYEDMVSKMAFIPEQYFEPCKGTVQSG